MSRIHSKRKGRSGSKRPRLGENPEWVPLDAAEIEERVVQMANEGLRPAMIGLRLRDQYGVPDVKLATGKTVTAIVAAKGIKPQIPEDLASLMRRAVELNVHLTEHPRDQHNRRGLQLIEAKIRRLVKYYHRERLLPDGWTYSLATAEIQLSR
jgi:small subunit ribosomal protein S15